MKVIILFLLFTLFSCKKSNRRDVDIEKLTTIDVDINSRNSKGEFDKYFSSYDIIPLETKKISLISNIDKIVVFKNHFFILDKQSNTVFIFDPKGEFINKIHKTGKGPSEYKGLRDFTIDENREEIILLTHIPQGIYRYDFKGVFIKKNILPSFNLNISSFGDELVFLNTFDEDLDLISTINTRGFKEKTYLKKTDKDVKFKSSGLGVSCLIKDAKLHLNLAYEHIIYEYSNKGFIPKFNINFGKNKLSSKKINELKTFNETFKYAIDNNLVFTVSDFRESKNFIVFKYNASKMVFYDKKTEKSECVRLFVKDNLPMSGYMAHDGNDDKLISINNSSIIQNQIVGYKNANTWNKIPMKVRGLFDEISEFDNPILFVYNLK